MKKLIVKFPRPGEDPFDTRVEVSFIENAEQRESITRTLEEAHFEVDPAVDNEVLHARHTSSEPGEAEEAVRFLGKNGFVEPITDRYDTSTPSQKSTC